MTKKINKELLEKYTEYYKWQFNEMIIDESFSIGYIPSNHKQFVSDCVDDMITVITITRSRQMYL